MRYVQTLIYLILINNIGFSQAIRPTIKFGDISVNDLQKKIYSIDSNANGIVLFDVCSSSYEGNRNGSFNIIYKYHTRIHLLNKNSFDRATIQIPLLGEGAVSEDMSDLNAVTYNLKNGVVTKTKVDKNSIFKEKTTKLLTKVKFTFPDIEEGSIIEYSYTITSPIFLYINDWSFQDELPVLWSECKTTIPSMFQFSAIKQGYLPYTISEVKTGTENYYIKSPYTNTFENTPKETVTTTLAIANIPALREESFTSTIKNHYSKIDFYLVALTSPTGVRTTVIKSWNQIIDNLLKSSHFGKDLKEKTKWIQDEVAIIINGETDTREKARKIFYYIRDNFNCTTEQATTTEQSLKKVFESKKGTVAELNLLLTAMLKNIDLEAYPVLLSTRKNGWINQEYPLFDKYNYLITALQLPEERILLDASIPKLGFGLLTTECYNGAARAIDISYNVLSLSTDSIKESKFTNVNVINKGNGKMEMIYTSNLGYYESLGLRQTLQNKKVDDWYNEKKKDYSVDFNWTEKSVEFINDYEDPVQIKFKAEVAMEEDIIYFSPLLNEAYKENPFKANKRIYPIEMPFTFNDTYMLNIETPKGYEIDEIPKSVKIKLNENDGVFEYFVSKSANGIQIRSTVSVNKANFEIEDYQTLRNFYSLIVKKHAEQIVYKKKK